MNIGRYSALEELNMSAAAAGLPTNSSAKMIAPLYLSWFQHYLFQITLKAFLSLRQYNAGMGAVVSLGRRILWLQCRRNSAQLPYGLRSLCCRTGAFQSFQHRLHFKRVQLRNGMPAGGFRQSLRPLDQGIALSSLSVAKSSLGTLQQYRKKPYFLFSAIMI